jgi:hypothetical protein
MASEQQSEALARANAVRLGRTALKRRMRAGEATLREALDSPYMQTATILETLMSLPRYGRVRSRHLLHMLQISEGRPVGEMTSQQRARLLGAL